MFNKIKQLYNIKIKLFWIFKSTFNIIRWIWHFYIAFCQQSELHFYCLPWVASFLCLSSESLCWTVSKGLLTTSCEPRALAKICSKQESLFNAILRVFGEWKRNSIVNKNCHAFWIFAMTILWQQNLNDLLSTRFLSFKFML